MKNKTIYKVSISVIAVLLIVALAMTLSSFMGMQTATESVLAEENLMYAQYNGTNGQITDDSAVDGHYTRAQIAAQVGVDATRILAITTGEALYNYLNNQGSEANYEYAYLESDVTLSNQNSTAATFSKYLDGNGYKLTLSVTGGEGNRASTGDMVGDASGNHKFMGYLTAINQGTIKNLTIDFSSNHSIISSPTSATNMLIIPSEDSVVSAGIVAGLNKGTIDNVRLNLNSVFSVYKKAASDRMLNRNTLYVGGIAGAMSEGIISNSQVNISSNGGVSAFTEGKDVGWGFACGSVAAAGGILGKIQVGNAKVQYCALTGSGTVNAIANQGSDYDGLVRKYAFAGGAIAMSTNVSNEGDVHMDSAVVNEGQIQGIISSWTGRRVDNWAGSSKSVSGLLFDAVGSNVQSCAVLYNLQLLTQQGGTAYNTLDSSQKIENWTAIYPTSDGGSMSVRYDSSTALYDLRIEAVADGHDDEKQAISEHDMSGTAVPYYKYFLNEGSTGKIIWSGVFIKNGAPTNHIDMSLDKPIYAEIYMLKASDYGTFNYTFGTMGELEYSDNGNVVNGQYVKQYTGQSGVLKLPKVAFKGNVIATGDFQWEVLRDGVVTSIDETYMPGTYRMRTSVKMGTNTYGYYNDSERIIAWQPKQDYVFTITQGTLSYGSGTTTSTDWETQYTFVLEMPQNNDFDLLRYQQNGAFADEEFKVSDTERSVTFTTTQGTGKNGMQYTFYAYKFDNILQDYVVVAVSESKTARIDNEAPEIYDVQYFEENSEGVRTPISASDLSTWRKDKVIVTYMVSDNGKSGINSLDQIAGVTNNEIQENSDYKVTLTLNDNTAYSLKYVDRTGNTSTFEIQANVDTVSGTLNAAISGYTQYNAMVGMYDYDGFYINASVSIGNSGWTMYISEATDENGEDIWKEFGAVTPDDRGDIRYTVDWNVGDYESFVSNPWAFEGATMKMKMVNDAGLYDDVYVQVGSNEPGILGKFLVYIKIADIYVSDTLESIVDENGNTLQSLLADPDYFNKVYDGTQGYSAHTFTVDMTKSSGIRVVYTDNYSATQPEITIKSVNLALEYERASIGDTNIRIWAVIGGEDSFKYDIWFADFDSADYQKEAWTIHKLGAKITKLQVTINLADYLEKQYTYGDDIPTYVEANITAEEVARIDLDTLAKKGASVGNYNVLGNLHEPNESIDITINSTSIAIVPQEVCVDIKFDGMDLPWKWQFDGKEHVLTVTYEDLFTGEIKEGSISYALGEDRVPATGLYNIGRYYLTVSTGDVNYAVDGQSEFIIEMVKGILNIETGVQEVEYTGESNSYDLGLTKDQLKYINEKEDVVITYYKYPDSAYYNEKTQKVEGGMYDRNNPTANTINRGLYYVEITIKDTEYFYGSTTPEGSGGLLIVKVAETVIESENVTYAYDSQKHTFDLKEGKVKVTASDGKTVLWDSSKPLSDEIVVKYWDNDAQMYMPVDMSEDKTVGWYLEVNDEKSGGYKFIIEYLGDEAGNYAESSLEVRLYITKADFKNVKFDSIVGTYNGQDFKQELINKTVIPDEYKNGANEEDDEDHTTITFSYGGVSATSLEDLPAFINQGTYRVTLTMTQDNYNKLTVVATVTVEAATITDISASPLVSTYNGEDQYLEFSGLELRDGHYYYMDHGKEVEAYIDGNYFAFNAGAYAGNVQIMIANYKTLSLETYIEIYPAEIKASDASITLPDKLPTGVSVNGYKGSYTDENGKKHTGSLLFYAPNSTTGELGLVKPDENGVLPDGTYTVRIEVDENHFIEQAWSVRIGQINDKNISTMGWIAIGIVGALMIAAIITSIVTVNRRKKRGTV